MKEGRKKKDRGNEREKERNVLQCSLGTSLFSKVLKKPEYFGKYGKIFKVVINQNTVYSGAQVSCKRKRVGGENWCTNYM